MFGAAGQLHRIIALTAAAFVVSGCADSLPSLPKINDLNPFAEKQQPLPGRRIPVLQTQENSALQELASADQPIMLPPPQVNDAWPQPGGAPNNSPGHLVLAGAPKQVWSASAGSGSSTAGRVTASPIVAGGRVFTLDAKSQVSAFSVSGGSAVWRVSLVPESEAKAGSGLMNFSFSSSASGGFGGGLAYENGRLYAASGFGRVVALDPASGKLLWEKNLGTPLRASPTVNGDRIYIVTMEGRFYCLSGADGSEIWVVRGLPQQASLVMSVSPAVDGDLVVVPYPSGDLVALRTSDGSAMWSDSLSRTRSTSQLASLSDAAMPAIDNGTVFAVGHAGRMIATSAATGERLWSLNIPGTQRPWVAGDTVYVADTEGQLMALARADGSVRWTVKLPGAKTWSGPTLAGGLLWVASSNGKLIGVEAGTGRIAQQLDVGGAVFIAPVVAQGHMYVLRDDAQLIMLN